MRACNCSERKRPLPSDLPAGSNERPRQWFVWTRHSRHYRSPGPLGSTWSRYSTVHCNVCGGYWKTKAPYVDKLQDCEYFPHDHPPQAQPYETLVSSQHPRALEE